MADDHVAGSAMLRGELFLGIADVRLCHETRVAPDDMWCPSSVQRVVLRCMVHVLVLFGCTLLLCNLLVL